MVTWPKRKPHFNEDEPSFALKASETPSLWWNVLAEKYTFFTQGEKFEGNQLLPLEFHLGVREAEEVESTLQLAEEAGSLRTYYNPADPTQNFLAVGHSHLSWGKVLVYAQLFMWAKAWKRQCAQSGQRLTPITSFLADHAQQENGPSMVIWILAKK